MGIAEALAKATSADDLGWSENKVKPVDMVAALSATSNLGSDLHRAKDRDSAALRRATLLLAAKAIKKGKAIKLPLSRAMAQAMAVTAIMERCIPNCRTCNGASVVIVESLKITCDTCGGVGVHRYSNRERARLCGIAPEQWGLLEKRYLMVLDLAISSDTAQRDASIRLGTLD